MQTLSSILILSLFALTVGCSRDGHDSPICEKKAKVDNTLYINTKTDNYTLVDATVNGNCLEIKLSASGCDGKSWTVELVDADALADSNPQQRFIKLALTNNELCTAVFSKTVSFDITPLRAMGTKSLRLKLDRLDKSLIYNY